MKKLWTRAGALLVLAAAWLLLCMWGVTPSFAAVMFLSVAVAAFTGARVGFYWCFAVALVILLALAIDACCHPFDEVLSHDWFWSNLRQFWKPVTLLAIPTALTLLLLLRVESLGDTITNAILWVLIGVPVVVGACIVWQCMHAEKNFGPLAVIILYPLVVGGMMQGSIAVGCFLLVAAHILGLVDVNSGCDESSPNHPPRTSPSWPRQPTFEEMFPPGKMCNKCGCINCTTHPYVL